MNAHSLRILFIDMNSFFASVEQQEQPEIRNKPVIVVPVVTNTTCALAASYEAKAYGIKTGTIVADAKRVCPGLKIVVARPRHYLHYHNVIVEILKEHFAVVQAFSIDEMSCELRFWQTTLNGAKEMAAIVKGDIKKKLGECIRSSIGVAPNTFLAKVAAECQKPDGYTVFDSNYTEILFQRELSDLPGIGPAMLKRLHNFDIKSIEQLWQFSPLELRNIWGGVVGERWYYMLRGSLTIDYGDFFRSKKRSISHSHVFPPKFRTIVGARSIVLRLASKALKRLRLNNLAARKMELSVVYRKENRYAERQYWQKTITWPEHANDDLLWIVLADNELEKLPDLIGYAPAKAYVVFNDLLPVDRLQQSLFDDRSKYSSLFTMIDGINSKYGPVINIGAIFAVQNEAPFRISFRV